MFYFEKAEGSLLNLIVINIWTIKNIPIYEWPLWQNN